MASKRTQAVVGGIVAVLCLVQLTYLVYSIPQRVHARANATLLVNFAAEVSCLTLQHVSRDKGSPEDNLRAAAEVNEMLQSVTVNDVRRETFALTFVPVRVGNEPAFEFAVDEKRAAKRGWSAALHQAVVVESHRRVILNTTTATSGEAESCQTALARFERRAKSGVTTVRSEAQLQPG